MFFVCYNHDVRHSDFDSREGFVRARVKFQGLVGIPRTKEGARLTWLVNYDPCGLIPQYASTHALLSAMFYPRQIVIEVEKQNMDDLFMSSQEEKDELRVLRERLDKAQADLRAARALDEQQQIQLSQQEAEISSLRRELDRQHRTLAMELVKRGK